MCNETNAIPKRESRLRHALHTRSWVVDYAYGSYGFVYYLYCYVLLVAPLLFLVFFLFCFPACSVVMCLPFSIKLPSGGATPGMVNLYRWMKTRYMTPFHSTFFSLHFHSNMSWLWRIGRQAKCVIFNGKSLACIWHLNKMTRIFGLEEWDSGRTFVTMRTTVCAGAFYI